MRYFLYVVTSSKKQGRKNYVDYYVLCSLCQIATVSNPLTSTLYPFAWRSLLQRQTCAGYFNRLTCPLVPSWVCPTGSPCRRKGAQQGTTCISLLPPSRVVLDWLHNHHQRLKVTAPLKVTLSTLHHCVQLLPLVPLCL